MLVYTILQVVFAVFLQPSYCTDIFRENRELLFEGEEQLKSVGKLTLSPYGTCWTSAVSSLKTTCPELTEETHQILAYTFANCFMQQLGFTSRTCNDQHISFCLEGMKSDTHWFQAYLQYYTHTHNMCYFLNHQLWLQKTESSIRKLTTSSDEIGRRLEETTNKQLELLNLQSESVDTQKALLQQGQNLNLYLENTQNSVVRVIDDFKKTTEGQQHLVMDMLDKLSSWIQFLVDHVTGIYTAAFYLTVPCILFIVTSTPRTNRARAWLVFLWMAVFVLELKIKFEHQALWYFRYLGMSCSLAIILYFGLVYKDYETLNNRILNELYHMVATQSQLAPLHPTKQLQGSVGPQEYSMVPVQSIPLDQVRNFLNSCSIREIEENETDRDSSSSDETFICDDGSDSGDSTTSFYSLSSSSASSAAVSPYASSGSSVSLLKGHSALCTVGEMDEPSMYVSDLPGQTHKYNLRERRSFGYTGINNSILLKESPRAFDELIKAQERNSKIHTIIQTRHIIGKKVH